MYSWEIEQLLKLKKYILNVEEYFKVCDSSPQIVRVTYNPFENNFRIITNDGFEWIFKVRREEDETRIHK